MRSKDQILSMFDAIPPGLRDITYPELMQKLHDENPAWLHGMLTINDAADFIGITPQALRQKIHRGEGPPVSRPNRGKSITISRLELIRWMRDQIVDLEEEGAF